MQLQLSVTAAAQEALLRSGAEALRSVCDNPRAEAERLLAEALAVSRSRLLAGLAPPPDVAQRTRYQHWLARRASGEPYAYLIGEQPFRQLSLRVTPEVLIPRPETELLVDWALDLLVDHPAPRVWDLATGSGCIALALAQERPDALVQASDVSPAALGVARGNAERLDLQRVVFFEADLFLAGHSRASGNPVLGAECESAKLDSRLRGNDQMNLIISNPPYIAEGDPHLPALTHEPRLALVAGEDGLALLRPLIAQAPAHLAPGGWLLLEHGWDQGPAVRALLQAAGFTDVQTRRDYAGHERMSGGKRG